MQKNYFITGANRGIGLAFCDRLLSEGNKVWASSRPLSNRQHLNQLKDQYGDKLVLLDLDITEISDIIKIKKIMHGISIDGLFNIAGIFDLPDHDFKLDFTPWEYILKVNSVGPTLLAENLLENLQQSSKPIIVNMSSDMGSIGDILMQFILPIAYLKPL